MSAARSVARARLTGRHLSHTKGSPLPVVTSNGFFEERVLLLAVINAML